LGDVQGFPDPVGPIVSSKTYTTSSLTLEANRFGESIFGTLRVSADSTFTEAGGLRGGTSTFADFLDIVTIDSPLFHGMPGESSMGYTLDGTITSSGFGSAQAEVVGCAGSLDACETSLAQIQDYTSSVSGSFSFPDLFTFTYGTPFDLFFSLAAVDHYTGSGSATADFTNTLRLSSLQLFGPDGQPVTGATFTSASGTQYGPNGVVPEPASALLLGSAAVLLISRCRKRSHRQRKFR